MKPLFHFANWLCDRFGDRRFLQAQLLIASLPKRPSEKIHGMEDILVLESNDAIAQCAADVAYYCYGPVDDKLKN